MEYNNQHIERDFESDIRLNKFALDEEILEQSMKYRYYSEIAVEAEAIRDDAKFAYETLEAQVEREIRGNPSAFNVDKITDNAIRAAMLCDTRIQESKRALLDATKTMKLTQRAERNIEDLKKNLETLVQLFLNNYWAEPRTPGLIEPTIAAGAAAQREGLKTSPRLIRREPPNIAKDS